MADTTWLWILFAVLVSGILAFDLGVLGRRGRRIGVREALVIVGAYVALALLFGASVFAWLGEGAGQAYLTAYLLEQSLSLDNVFLWVLVFEHLRVPENAQHKVLFWGILGAILLRGVFIFAGTALIEAFDWVLYVFGAVVILSGLRLLRSGGRAARRDIAANPVMRFLARHLQVEDHYEGRRFFLRRGGQLRATPLLVALVVIETTDLVFALDSIPAIFGVTRDPLVVYTSNVFAVVGLRALYFAVAGLVERLRYLHYGLALLLVLIGVKMIAGELGEIPLWLTLGATVAILGGTIALSLLRGGARRR